MLKRRKAAAIAAGRRFRSKYQRWISQATDSAEEAVNSQQHWKAGIHLDVSTHGNITCSNGLTQVHVRLPDQIL